MRSLHSFALLLLLFGMMGLAFTASAYYDRTRSRQFFVRTNVCDTNDIFHADRQRFAHYRSSKAFYQAKKCAVKHKRSRLRNVNP